MASGLGATSLGDGDGEGDGEGDGDGDGDGDGEGDGDGDGLGDASTDASVSSRSATFLRFCAFVAVMSALALSCWTTCRKSLSAARSAEASLALAASVTAFILVCSSA
jgi:hypothetical protein